MSRSPVKVENDPWLPLLDTSAVCVTPPPMDPLRQMIDSGRYIETLEKRLNRIKGKRNKDPSSADIINSLALFRDDQMRRFLENEPDVTLSSTVTLSSAVTTQVSSASSYIQRRLHPERQAVNFDELFELLKDDELARLKNEQDAEEEIFQHEEAQNIHEVQECSLKLSSFSVQDINIKNALDQSGDAE